MLGLTPPRRRPPARASYSKLIASLIGLLGQELKLSRRAFTASPVMVAFSVFGTALALRLSAWPFDLGKKALRCSVWLPPGCGGDADLRPRRRTRFYASATVLYHLVLIAALGFAPWPARPPAPHSCRSFS
ncbi:hypothetical protein [Mesorhizobium sp. INR15]|uniref:hypothetical protein n=1 Tax=Mesorhizobium sp. INR15 TaxID=2654248 RepID=UPI0018964467|nr:hypothetical protein [Mesorhizobium sp. INR15]QPC89725.1 hypothetical protein GA829_03485 [Mesorhizobium sp. INR15]